ncbi:uncharacterized protein [Rutidosis leptorrhynchoides]|uniref:uncharacterized protein n=1 Tax=Rutidosis leptorrhynchoides TaxID=125765 RepID=UPI003A998989
MVIPLMASNTTNLRQLLQHKQEPFKLNIYLLERGYTISEPNSKTFASYNASKVLKFRVNKRRKMVSLFSKTLKALANKLLVVKNIHTNSVKRIDRGKYNWSNCMENKRNLSPVSLLEEEAYCDHNPQVHNVKEDIVNVSTKKPKLLLDCMMEVFQTYKQKNIKQRQQDFMTDEEIRRLTNENVLKWSKQSTNDDSKFDLWASFDDWKYDSRQERIRIAKTIGDSILNDIVISEFVRVSSN